MIIKMAKDLDVEENMIRQTKNNIKNLNKIITEI